MERGWAWVAAAIVLAACSHAATTAAPEARDPGYGPEPTLPAPQKKLIPTVRIAPAKPWPPGTAPAAAAGLAVNAFATGLQHPRWLLVLPNGDVLVAETNAPARPDDGKGLKGALMKLEMKKAGAAAANASRITLLRDADGDGRAETREVLLPNLNSPFGMALVDGRLYVANTDAVVWFPYRAGDTRIADAGTKLVDLPGGPINHHWTKNLIANADGSRLYVTIGSNSNVGERGLAAEDGRAAIWEVDTATGRHRVFASGLRNPNGLAWEPGSKVLWTVVNERDELGNNLVPDFLTSVRDGGFYGWPWSYYGAHVDERVTPPRPDMVARAVPPDYALGSHTASLGLTFSAGTSLGPAYTHGVFVGQHGSWNRDPPSGYKVIFVPFDGPKPAAGAMPVEVLTGFLGPEGEARGRPVGVALDKRGALLVADDVGDTVWRVSRASP
ncbi:sorbosone dehydrogenase family protein [Ideonella sp.]|uniref:PQQ-dependent sugar dehydrogenase n=1 Tax=Ideonella sp. TaxID=1929293 RepID=UPI002B48D776|nr:sorbosone dehydrogenase family protein [Ideonella sp.]HJV71335.1 sorbosone dehydrogenase family protein [Ideonella sp.]